MRFEDKTEIRGGAGALLGDRAMDFLRARLVDLSGLGLMALGGGILWTWFDHHMGGAPADETMPSLIGSEIGMVGYYASDLLPDVVVEGALSAGSAAVHYFYALPEILGLAAVFVGLAPIVWGLRIVLRSRLDQIGIRLLGVVAATGVAAMALAVVPPSDVWPLAVGLGGYGGEIMLETTSTIVRAAGASVSELVGYEVAAGFEPWMAAVVAGLLGVVLASFGFAIHFRDWLIGARSLGLAVIYLPRMWIRNRRELRQELKKLRARQRADRISDFTYDEDVDVVESPTMPELSLQNHDDGRDRVRPEGPAHSPPAREPAGDGLGAKGKALAKKVRKQLVPVVSPLFSLPDFLVIGAMKAGTTSLHYYLLQHPQIVPPKDKETQFFNVHYYRGESWYRLNFCSKIKKAVVGQWNRYRTRGIESDRVITYDASPGYLPHPYVPDRVRRHLPQAKLIVVLRDPVERAWSHYRHNVKYGLEKASFAEALEREKHLLIDENGEKVSLERYNRGFEHFTYAGRSFYLDQIERWLKRFPASQFLFLTTDALEYDAGRVMQEVFDFLGVEPDVEIDLEPQRVDREPDPIPGEMRAVLARAYAEMNTALGELVGPEFDWNDRYADLLEETGGQQAPPAAAPRHETPAETPEASGHDSPGSADESAREASDPGESGDAAVTGLSVLGLKDCMQPSVVESAARRQPEPERQPNRSEAISVATLAAELRQDVQEEADSNRRDGEPEPIRYRTSLTA